MESFCAKEALPAAVRLTGAIARNIMNLRFCSAVWGLQSPQFSFYIKESTMLNQSMYALGAARSSIRELFEYGLQQQSIVGAENVFDYSLGNPSIPAPPAVNAAIVDIVTHENSLQVHGYTPAAGCAEVRRAVADDLNRRFDAAIRPENLFFTCGAAPALISVLRALAVPQAEVIAIAPYFPEYKPFAEASGCKLVVVPADTAQFQIDFDALRRCITQNTQAIIVNSPNNPAGTVYTAQTLRQLSALLTQMSETIGHPIYLIADEPYRELVYGGVTVPFIPKLYSNTIVCYSWSKSLSLPGERIGYVCVPDQVTDSAALFAAVAGAARASGHVCPPSLLQRVVARCVGYAPDLAAYEKNRSLLYGSLCEMGYTVAKPDGAFYLFIKAPNGDGDAFSALAKRYNLLLVPGRDFGCAEYFRICYCVDYEMIVRSLPLFQKLWDEVAAQNNQS
jgi:aspartate aminotransferase